MKLICKTHGEIESNLLINGSGFCPYCLNTFIETAKPYAELASVMSEYYKILLSEEQPKVVESIK